MEQQRNAYDEEAYDTQLEQMVDSGVYSYELARFVLGMPPYELDTSYRGGLTFDTPSREDRVVVALDSYDVSQEPAAAYNHLLSDELPTPAPKTAEQLDRDRRGRGRVRLAMRARAA